MSPAALTLGTVILWSTGALTGKLLSDSGVFLPAVLSFFFTVLVFGVGFWFWEGVGFFRSVPWLRWHYWLYGLCGYLLYWLLYFTSFRSLESASQAALLNYTWPVFTVLFTNIFFQRRKRSSTVVAREGTGMVLGIIAVALIVSRGEVSALTFSSPAGIAAGLGAGAVYGLFSAFSATVPATLQKQFLFMGSVGSLVLGAPLLMFEDLSSAHLGLIQIGVAFWSGAILDGVGYFLWTSANRRAREKGIAVASFASLTLALPLLSTLVIALSLGERDLLNPAFGLGVIMLVLSAWFCRKQA